jgi:CubicO group peptidase (beta-lactamase class C family)
VKALPTHDLVSLPSQPAGVPWPTTEWPTADPAELGADVARLTDLLDELVSGEPHPDHGLSYAAAVVAGGRLVAERYGRRVVQDLRSLEPDPPHEDVTADSSLLSWSMAKSITNLAVGTAVADGRLRLDDPVGDPCWTAAPDDPRAAITWDDLLTMRPGLAWTEEYYDLEIGAMPDVVTMLFGEGAADVAAYAADKPLVATPGTPAAYVYSSGTTNIIAANLQRVLGLDGPAMDAYLHARILDPIGMGSATCDFDPVGTFIGSSYVHATLRDWCRFGLLALRGGTWDGRALVPEGWMDWSRRARSWDETVLHGAQWWAWDLPETPFGAHGFEGQRVIAFPARDVVVLRFGKAGPDDAPALNAHLVEIARCFPTR